MRGAGKAGPGEGRLRGPGRGMRWGRGLPPALLRRPGRLPRRAPVSQRLTGPAPPRPAPRRLSDSALLCDVTARLGNPS